MPLPWEGIIFNLLAFTHKGVWGFGILLMYESPPPYTHTHTQMHMHTMLGAALKLVRPECPRTRLTSTGAEMYPLDHAQCEVLHFPCCPEQNVQLSLGPGPEHP